MSSQAKYSIAAMIIEMINRDRFHGESYAVEMRAFRIKVTDIMAANDQKIRAGLISGSRVDCGYVHPRQMCRNSSQFDSPENGRADDYYEHGSH